MELSIVNQNKILSLQGNKEEERLSLNPERDFFLFFSWCCGFFMIGYVVFFSRSFSFFYSSSHSYQILENVIICSGGLQILILIAAGLQIQQNKEFPTQEDFICRDAINRVSTNKIFLCREFLVLLDLQSSSYEYKDL